MNFSDFSSVFELLCGYNFVNSIDNKGVLEVLSFARPLEQEINDTSERIRTKIDEIEEIKRKLPGSESHLINLYDWKRKANGYKTSNEQHNKFILIFYLFSGIFIFLFLASYAYIIQYEKLNGLVSIFIITIPLLFLLGYSGKKFCEKKRNKLYLLGGTIIIIVLLYLQDRNNWMFFLETDIYMIVGLMTIISCVFWLAKNYIMQKKFYTAIFIILSLLLAFNLNSSFKIFNFYDNDGDVEHEMAWVVLCVLVIAIIPVCWDLIYKSFLKNNLINLNEKVSLMNRLKEEMLPESSMEPFRGIPNDRED